jgi:hypothetical protein
MQSKEMPFLKTVFDPRRKGSFGAKEKRMANLGYSWPGKGFSVD